MNALGDGKQVKLKTALRSEGQGAWSSYVHLMHGRQVSLGRVVRTELVTFFVGSISGPLGLLLRKWLYPGLLGGAGRNLLVGRNVTFRHSSKIRIGNNVVIDDNAVIDAKGSSNRGITIGDDVFIGRNTIVYCKNGDISIGRGVNLSANCCLFSSNDLTLEPDIMVGAYSYLLSGGGYDPTEREVPFVDQAGMETKGPLTIGTNSWLGARVTVLDGASIGRHCVIGAGAVVNRPIPADSLAVGMPAKVLKSI
jgi:acetyltransferase-like isoleucine patch superfamily enzyme